MVHKKKNVSIYLKIWYVHLKIKKKKKKHLTFV